MPTLAVARYSHACCTVRGALVFLGGFVAAEDGEEPTSSVESLSKQPGGVFTNLPPLSCGGIANAVAIAVEESDSVAGQVLLLGGSNIESYGPTTAVHLVDLATGTCTLQPALLHSRCDFSAVRMPDGRVVCAGGRGIDGTLSSVEVWGSPANQASHAAWTWTQLPLMIYGRDDCCGCVMSNGRLAILGGMTPAGDNTSSCEVSVVGEDEQWHSLPPMHHALCGRSN